MSKPSVLISSLYLSEKSYAIFQHGWLQELDQFPQCAFSHSSSKPVSVYTQPQMFYERTAAGLWIAICCLEIVVIRELAAISMFLFPRTEGEAWISQPAGEVLQDASEGTKWQYPVRPPRSQQLGTTANKGQDYAVYEGHAHRCQHSPCWGCLLQG